VKIVLKHANLKGDITIFVDQVFGVMYLEEHKCVGIVGPGNAVAPVQGALEEIARQVETAKLDFYKSVMKGDNKNVGTTEQ
jgi:hypothetical protein